MTRPHSITGALLAAVTAGPSFVLVMLAQFAFVAGATTSDWLHLTILLVFAAMFGFVIAFVPSVLGSAALARLGARRLWARHPLIWAMAGFAIGLVIGLAFLRVGGIDANQPGLMQGASFFALAGMPCALLARWRTRWLD